MVAYGRVPKTWLPKLYQLNSKLWLTFLARIETNTKEPYFNPQLA